MKKQKMRVYWIPQVPMKAFHVEVDSVTEAVKIMNILADYDLFQLENNVKPDYCNTGGLQVYNEEEKEWEDWTVGFQMPVDGEIQDLYFDNGEEVEFLNFLNERGLTEDEFYSEG